MQLFYTLESTCSKWLYLLFSSEHAMQTVIMWDQCIVCIENSSKRLIDYRYHIHVSVL